MYCRKKNRRKFRHKINENRRQNKERGQPISKLFVEQLVITSCYGDKILDSIFDKWIGCRSIQKRVRQKELFCK